MAKIKKVHRRKRYKYRVNRKRLDKLKVPAIQNEVLKKAWKSQNSAKKNLQKMGLVFDVNASLKEKPEENVVISKSNTKSASNEIVKALEEDASAPRKKEYRIPKGQVEYLTYLMDKYGEDYKAMVRDRRNHLQHTWKQLRNKIKVFKSIPEQYEKYLEKKTITSSNSGL